MRLATIDIGTNTTLLLVADVRSRPGQACTAKDVEVLAEWAQITRLGRGIGADGGLGREAIERTLRVLRDYKAIAGENGATVYAIGTEALRRAPNSADFLGPAAMVLGNAVEVIDGEREAALSFLAAERSFPEATLGTTTVVDIGGGSTEIIVARASRIDVRRSLPIGSVRLTERHIFSDPAADAEVAAVTQAVDSALADIPFPEERATLIGTAGTVTSLAAMSLGLSSYDPKIVHGHRLTIAALDGEIQRLRLLRQAEREKIAGLDPKRADVILAGAIILAGIARAARANEILVSDRGIRWGLLFEKAEQVAKG